MKETNCLRCGRFLPKELVGLCLCDNCYETYCKWCEQNFEKIQKIMNSKTNILKLFLEETKNG